MCRVLFRSTCFRRNLRSVCVSVGTARGLIDVFLLAWLVRVQVVVHKLVHEVHVMVHVYDSLKRVTAWLDGGNRNGRGPVRAETREVSH